MATHLSARLTWHEDAWNGRICWHPALNAACMVHEHVRKARKDDIEEANRGLGLGVVRQKTGYLPPCQRDANAFGEEQFFIRHDDPLEGRGLHRGAEDMHARDAGRRR